MLDVAVAYNRYRFLGNEFLTWLWFMVEAHQNRFQALDHDISGIEIGNRIVLENRNQSGIETITIKGDDAGLEEGLLALSKGALVTELNLVYRAGDHQWQFNLKGESLNISSLKTPQTAQPESREDMAGFVLDKIGLYEKVVEFVEKTFKFFIQLRISAEWEKTVVPQVKHWLLNETD